MRTFEFRRSALLTIFIAAAISIGAACDPKSEVNVKPAASPAPAATASPSASPAASPGAATPAGADKLTGRWNGPEGTYLSITEKPPVAGKDAVRKFTVEIKNLDKTESFEGSAKGDTIEFSRKGKTETVRAATGTETGMKDFEKETNCLVINKGSEGYCKKSGS